MQKNRILVILAIVSISLIPAQAFAERIVSFEKTLPTDKEKLVEVFSDLESYPQVLPNNVKSSVIVNAEENISKMTFKFKIITVDADVKFYSPSPDVVILEVVSGDLKGTTLTGKLTDIENVQGSMGTNVKTDLDLKISWYLSLATAFISDENIESMLDSSLKKFSNYANNPQPPETLEKEPEETCFLVWCW
jgi:ribosome-associated toxin RatA of RatAB toxin-antitoxin module